MGTTHRKADAGPHGPRSPEVGRRAWWCAWGRWVALALLALGAAGCGAGSGRATPEAAGTISVVVALPAPAGQTASPAVFAPLLAIPMNFSEVGSVTVTVYDEAATVVATQSLSQDGGGNWVGSITGLPLATTLRFRAEARHGVTAALLFLGTQWTVLQEGGNSLGLVLAYVGNLDGPLPRIEQIAISPEIAVGGTDRVQALVSGPPSDTLTYAFGASAGSFTNTSGSVVLDSAGYGFITTDYLAPGSAGLYSLTFRVTNSVGNAVVGTFAANVVVLPRSNYLTSAAAAPVDCPSGGVRISSGIDENGNGVLDLPDEEDRFFLVCNGSDGANGFPFLTVNTMEPPGANCASGGQRVETGLDDGQPGGTANDGVLDSLEIDQTAFLCDGGQPLVQTTVEPPGMFCSNGGTRIEAGRDTNANGILDAGEITSTDYVCASAPFGEGIVFIGDKETNNKFDLFRAHEDGTGATRIAGASFLGGNVAEYSISPDGSRVLVYGDLENVGLKDLFLVELQDGGRPVKVTGWLVGAGSRIKESNLISSTPHPHMSWFLWSPDGTRIAFMFERMDVGYTYWASSHLAVVDLARGGTAQEISPDVSASHYLNVASFAWSPDSTQLAFRADLVTDGSNELFVINADGTGVQKVNPAGITVSSGYLWAPDGSHLAFFGSDETVYDVRPDGLAISFFSPGPGFLNRLRWSPDSAWMAFTYLPQGSNAQELWVVEPGGGNNFDVTGTTQSNASIGFIQWAPDSSKVAYIGDMDTDGVEELFVGEPWGVPPTKVSGVLAPGASLSSLWLAFAPLIRGTSEESNIWSPDSTRLAYVVDADQDGDDELFTTLANGGGATQINDPVDVPSVLPFFEWAPAGSRLAYEGADAGGNFALYVAQGDGSVEVAVTPAAPFPTIPFYDFKWAPDGTRLGYSMFDYFTESKQAVHVALADGSGSVKVSGDLVPYGEIWSFLWRDIETLPHMTMTALKVAPDQPYMESNSSYRLRAWGTFSDGTVREVSESVDWSSTGSVTGTALDGVKGRIATASGTSGTTATVTATDPETGVASTITVRVQDLAGTFTEKAINPYLGSAENFGEAVAASGNLAIVGAPSSNRYTTDSGAAYLMERDSGGAWSAPIELAPPGGVQGFGIGVAIDGDWALVGEYPDGTVSPISGEAHFYKRDSGTNTWSLSQTISAQSIRDGFGFAVALDGDTALVGAYHTRVDQDDNGAVYLYKRGWDDQWRLEATLIEPAAYRAQDNIFGYAIGLEGDVAVVGAPASEGGNGAVYIYERVHGQWPTTGTRFAEAQSDAALGVSVDVERERVVAGANLFDNVFSDDGAVFLFEKSGGVWSQSRSFFGTSSNELLGDSVAIDGNRILVGAPHWDGSSGKQGRGYAIAYDPDTQTWQNSEFATMLWAPDGETNDNLGLRTVGLSGSLSVLGASNLDYISYSWIGGVYIFE